MPDAVLPAPFEAYVGDQPYLFASYAHVDAPTVFPELTYLRNLGIRVWYDEGIDPGNEWPEEVAKALAGASYFLVFISSHSVTSQNVRNEINFALNNQKGFLAVHIEETRLPPGLELRMGDIQAIMKYRMSDDSYQRKIEKALPRSLLSSVVLDERDLQAKISSEILSGLMRVVSLDEAWAFGVATVWLTDHSRLLMCDWTVDWETVTPAQRREFGEHSPPRTFEAWVENILPDYAARVLRGNQILLSNTPLSQFRILRSVKPQFDSPWHVVEAHGMGEVDFRCKQCGYDGFSLGHYDTDRSVPHECPRCALGRDMPADPKSY